MMSLLSTSRLCNKWVQLASRSLGSMSSLTISMYGKPGYQMEDIRPLSTSCIRSAGHSHWQNTKHIKAAGDRQKSLNSMKTRTAIFKAVQSGGPDPKLNNQLAKAYDLGNSLNVPKKSMKRFLDQATGKVMDDLVLPIRGATGCVFVLSYIAMNKGQLTKMVRKLAGKAGGTLMDNSIITQVFYKKAVVEAQFNEPTSFEEAETIALECDIEEVTPVPDSELAFKFTSEPEELHRMTNALTERGLEISSSEVEHIPFERVKLSQEDKDLWTSTIEKLSNLDDELQSIFDNVEW